MGFWFNYIKYFAFRIIVVLISNSIFAKTVNTSIEKHQKATLHFHDGTDLEGLAKVKTLLSVNTIKFKLYDDSESDVWTELMVRGIIFHEEFEDVYFEYVIVHKTKRPRLIKVLEKEAESLYVDIDKYWVFYSDDIIPNQSLSREQGFKFYVLRESEEKATFVVS